MTAIRPLARWPARGNPARSGRTTPTPLSSSLTSGRARPRFLAGLASRLDDLVDAEWDDERFAETTFGSDASFDDRAFSSVVRELGGYFGEVLVRHLDGDWTDETDHEAAVVVGGPAGQFAVPVFKVAMPSLRQRRCWPELRRPLDDLGREGPAR
ncbi:hypothetical protein C9J85_13985 [Haloferax sp. wsp5]|nr:hypothetical protein C9J85_13985 [Haloferax sp. wsp5]